MDWTKVRHIVLTVDRSVPPAAAYDSIRGHKTIPRLVSDLELKGEQWLWVLEFHTGGFPHWHLLVESQRGMIGKRRIESAWAWGLVWESYIKSESHWQAISGYHKSKGYLAGESKGHQLELPEWAMDRARVRKFAGNHRERADDIAENRCEGGSVAVNRRDKAGTYRERIASCGQGVRLRCAGQWAASGMGAGEAAGIAGSRLQTRGKGVYEGESAAVCRTANRILKG